MGIFYKAKVVLSAFFVIFDRSIGQNRTKAVHLGEIPFMDSSCASRAFHDHECKSDVHKTALLSM